jgi:arylsulfatase A-like enzyme
VVTADHGEEFYEKGRFGHTAWLVQNLIQVPLIVAMPDRIELHTSTVEEVVEVRGLFSVFLRLSDASGVDLTAQALLRPAGTGVGEEPTAVSFILKRPNGSCEARAVVGRRFKLVEYRTSGELELYDLIADPDENHNLAGRAELADVVAELHAHLERHPLEAAVAEPAVLSESTRERLKALGYLN